MWSTPSLHAESGDLFSIIGLYFRFKTRIWGTLTTIFNLSNPLQEHQEHGTVSPSCTIFEFFLSELAIFASDGVKIFLLILCSDPLLLLRARINWLFWFLQQKLVHYIFITSINQYNLFSRIKDRNRVPLTKKIAIIKQKVGHTLTYIIPTVTKEKTIKSQL